MLGRKTWAKILYKRHKIRQYVQHSGMKINSHQVNLKMNTISLKKILKVFAFGKLMIKFYLKKNVRMKLAKNILNKQGILKSNFLTK